MDPSKDIDVIPSFATDKWCFDVEYMCEDDERGRPTLTDTSSKTYVDILSVDAAAPTPIPGPSGT